MAQNQQYLSDEEKDEIQNEAAKAKEDAAKTVEENLGTFTTPEQQKAAFKKLFSALDIVIDEAEEEIRGSQNLTSEQKAQLLASLAKVEANLNSCESAIDAATTQTELNAAYTKCVENVKQTINDFMNEVYAVMLDALDEYLKASKTFLTTTRASVTLFESCDAVTDEDIDELKKFLDQGDDLWTQLNEQYQKMLGIEYQRENVVKAADLTARLSAVMGRIYGEYEDQYAIYEESCGNIPGDLKTLEDVEQQIEDELENLQ